MSQAATPARNSKKPFLVIPQDYKLFPCRHIAKLISVLAAMPFPETFLPVLLPMPWRAEILSRIVLEKYRAAFRAEADTLALGQQHIREQSRRGIQAVKRQFYAPSVIPRHQFDPTQCCRGCCC